ncbi:MAG: hypothetical protein IPO22_19925 [Anaerolineales bacterium]|jgi:hypothetical protein|nr:hypothetical protein [Anaerolineales bacterium]
MNSLEEMIMEEISTLPEMELIDVLGFIRYLKSESHGKHEHIQQWLEGTQKSIHARKAELKITDEDIAAQIQKRNSRKK